MGRIQIAEDTPRASAATADGVTVSATIQGGSGSLRQGIVRHMVVRFELPEGLHIYGGLVPDGMLPTTISVSGPPGLVTETPVLPPTETLILKGMEVELQVWSGVVDIRVPIYPVGELVSEVRPLGHESVSIEIAVSYQACDDRTCQLPKSAALSLDLPLEAIDVPAIAVHMGHGQREGNHGGTSHLKRLLQRKGDTRQDTI